jgi:hypothetical protein
MPECLALNSLGFQAKRWSVPKPAYQAGRKHTTRLLYTKTKGKRTASGRQGTTPLPAKAGSLLVRSYE